MDCSQVFDNVKYEKAKAAARYNQYRKMNRILQILEVLVACALISWSSTRLPGALKISGRALIEFGKYVCNPHVVFFIGNAIVAVLFFFRRAVAGNDEAAGSGEIYDEYVRHADRKPLAAEEIIASSAPPLSATEDFHGGDAVAADEDEEKQIVCVFEEVKEVAEQCDVVSEAIEAATKQIEKFQRTQSVKLKREITSAAEARPSKAELRRSETVKVRGIRYERRNRIETVSVDTVEKLSDEEFNMTIEAYIKRHREYISCGGEVTTKPSG